MANTGIAMNQLRQLIRLHFQGNLSQDKIAKSLGLSKGAVNRYIKRIKEVELSWPLPETFDDDNALVALFRSGTPLKKKHAADEVDCSYIHQELKCKGVTLQLLFDEYHKGAVCPYSYSQFCRIYRQWLGKQDISLRHSHKAGDKVFVDYCGDTLDVMCPDTGEIRKAQIFVGVLGASNYTFSEAVWDQTLPNWIASHVRMFAFFGGVPALVVPDNLKSAVSKSCRYEPSINRSYADCISHYNSAVLPARPYKPKDKAKAENAVLIVERQILARLRHRRFLNLEDANDAIALLLAELNNRPFQKLPGSRLSQFQAIDKPALRPLPSSPYVYAEFKKARVHIDYHVEYNKHYYSVPHSLIKQEVELRISGLTLECFHKNQRVASHLLSSRIGGHTTIREHMPKAHQKHTQWTPRRFLNWATDIGPHTHDVVDHLLTTRPHPEQGYRSCLGLLSLAKQYGNQRLEDACKRALELRTLSRKSIASMLEKGLDKQPTTSTQDNSLATSTHANIRGPHYYQQYLNANS